MKINKLSFYGAMIAAASFCSTMAFAGVHHRADNNPPPPPPRGELHERLCEGGNCCNLDVDGRSLNYTLRCDHPFKDADLYIGKHRPEQMRIYDRGRLSHEIKQNEHLELRINYAPPPPPPHNPHARDLNNKHRR